MTLAQSMLDSKIIPSDWIYENIFHFSEDEYDEYRELVRQDQKRTFRNAQIEAEGNDPLETGRSYGTPHDLASLYGKGRMFSDPSNIPDGYDENITKKTPLGRPKIQLTKRNKQEGNFGKDRLGVKRMKDDDSVNENNATHIWAKYENMLKNIPITKKEIILEEKSKKQKS